MHKELLIFLLFSCKVSFSQDALDIPYEEDVQYWQNGNKKYEVLQTEAEDNDYAFTYWFPNGKVQKTGCFDNVYYPLYYIYSSYDSTGKSLVVNGNGVHKEYYENGKLKEKGLIKNGLQIGIWKSYYQNGKLKSIGKYKLSNWKINNIIRKDSLWKFYFDNGQISSTRFYHDGLPYGIANFYYKDGKIRSVEENYKYTKAWNKYGKQTLFNGTGKKIIYHDNGKIKSIIFCTKNEIDSAFTYYPNRKLRSIELYNVKNTSIKTNPVFYDSLGNATIIDGNGYYLTSQDEYFQKIILKNYKIAAILSYENNILKSLTLMDLGQFTYFRNGNIKSRSLLTRDYKSNSIEYYINGNIKQVKDSTFTITNYYSNKQIKSIGYTIDYIKIHHENKFILGIENEYVENQPTGSYNNYEWSKKWYLNGILQQNIAFDTTTNKFILYEYHQTGNLKSIGNFMEDKLYYKCKDSQNENCYFYGYLKVGIWKYYDLNGTLTSTKDFDIETSKNLKTLRTDDDYDY
jgi:antitoxin component YwqK of YwqJK toxin-antitoxin module